MRTKRIIIPVHSLGISALSLLPAFCVCGRHCLSRASSVLVRIEPSDIPKDLRSAIKPETLRGGGPLISQKSKQLKLACFKIVAWTFNLLVFMYGLAFLLYSQLVVLEEASTHWTGAVMIAFAVSCIFSFLLTDVVVAVLVSLLPMKSKRTRHPISQVLSLLANMIENVLE